MLPSDLAWHGLLWVTAAAITLLVTLGGWAVIQRLRRRPFGTGFLRITLVAAGFVLGSAFLGMEGRPLVRLVIVGLGFVLVAGVTWTRPRTGGAVIVALAVPWVAWWASFLLDNTFAGRHWVVGDVVPPFLAGAAIGLAGIALFVAGGTPERLRHPAPPAEPVKRTFGVTGQVLVGRKVLGMATYELAMTVVLLGAGVITASATRGRSAVEAGLVITVGVALAWLAACAAWVFVRRTPDRRAWEAFAWLGEWELDRYIAVAGGPALPTKGDFRRWLRSSPDRPDVGWIRYGLWVMEGNLDHARAVAETIPQQTPYDVVEREGALAAVDWYAGGPGDTEALRNATEAIVPLSGEERLRAEVALAAADVRRLIAGGDADPSRPMRLVRDRLGPRADGILWQALRRRVWPQVLKTSLVIVLGVILFDRLTSLG